MSQVSKKVVAVYVVVALILSAVIGFALVQMTMSVRAVASIVIVPKTQIASASISGMTSGFAQLVRDESFASALQISDFGGLENVQNIGAGAQIEISVPTEAMIRIEAIAPTTDASLQFAQDTVDGVSRWIERYYPQQYAVMPMPIVAREAWGISLALVLILGVVGGFVLSGLIFAVTTLLGRRQSAQIMRGKIHSQIIPQNKSQFDMQSLAQKASIKSVSKNSVKTSVKASVETPVEVLENVGDADVVAQDEDYMRSTYADYDQLIAQTMNVDTAGDAKKKDTINEGESQSDKNNKNNKNDKGVKNGEKTENDKTVKKGVGESMASKLRKIAATKVATAMPPGNLPMIDEQDNDQSSETKQIAQNAKQAKTPTAEEARKRLNELLSGKS